MDIYFFSLILGVLGLAVMATFGLGRHSHGGGLGHGGGHGGSHGHGHGPAHGGGHASFGAGSRAAGWILMSPRLLFAGLLGFGVVGVALNSVLDGVILFVVALVGAIALERLLFNPIWKLSMRFASNPAEHDRVDDHRQDADRGRRISTRMARGSSRWWSTARRSR